ncbi:T-complex protein 1 subunit theta-like [Rhopilema esculentum]|uniref:T-complex protein 1 subunit theta-like n=1 Tax=Rhopilema esculentum TaxID=499914 RepID=UPI0031D39472|eukprot:gene17183-8721_t
MAMSIPRTVLQSMMKEGAKHYSGLDEAVYRNLEACKQFTDITRSSYGPNGMNKMVINHLEKLFVTNDAATVIKELEVQHPAAKMIVMAANMQEQEAGDGTNFVLIFAGALLREAEKLLRMGLSPSEVVDGFDIALKRALEILPDLVCANAKNLRDPSEVAKFIKPTIASKQYGNEDFLSELIAKACISIYRQDGSFNVDSVRVSKILGSGMHASEVVRGMVFQREAEGDIRKVENAKIAVFSCALDSATTDTKGTVLIKAAEELMNFSKGEEDLLEAQIRGVAETGVNMIVSGGKVADMALHFCNKYKIMVLRLNSKFDLRRLSRAVQAIILPKITVPTAEEIGHCDHVTAAEIGEAPVTIFRQEREETAVSTIVVRGATQNILDDIERSIDDGVNTFKAFTRDARLLPGAAATEIEIAHQLQKYSQTLPGLEQYSVRKYAEAFEAFPKALAENSGTKATELISNLYAAHNAGEKTIGFNIEGEGASTLDAAEAGILDSYLVKYWAIKYASNAAMTVLKVDQIIMAKAAGGPKPKENKNWDED